MGGSGQVKIVVSAVAATAVSIATGVLINLITDRPGLGLLAGLVVVACVAVVLKVRASGHEGPVGGGASVRAAGRGSVVIGGDNDGEITTSSAPGDAVGAAGAVDARVAATGSGSVAVGGGNRARIVTGGDGSSAHPEGQTGEVR